jgi:hypothetical protein
VFHLLAYQNALGVNATNADLLAVADPEFSSRNNHFIFTEEWYAQAIRLQAPSIIRGRFNIPTLNAYARAQIFPNPRTATIESNPQVMELFDLPMKLPQNEEIAVEATNNLGAATESTVCLIWLGAPSWSRNVPRGVQRLLVRATSSVAGVANAWSGLGALTFAETLRGGLYSVVGAQCFDAGTLAFRLVFPRPSIVQGRKMRPGGLCLEALGNIPWERQQGGMGEWGRFTSWDPPQVEMFANATGASTQEWWLDLVFLGEHGGY